MREGPVKKRLECIVSNTLKVLSQYKDDSVHNKIVEHLVEVNESIEDSLPSGGLQYSIGLIERKIENLEWYYHENACKNDNIERLKTLSSLFYHRHLKVQWVDFNHINEGKFYFCCDRKYWDVILQDWLNMRLSEISNHEYILNHLSHEELKSFKEFDSKAHEYFNTFKYEFQKQEEFEDDVKRLVWVTYISNSNKFRNGFLDLKFAEMNLLEIDNPSGIQVELKERDGTRWEASQRGGVFFFWDKKKEKLEKNQSKLFPTDFESISFVIGKAFFISWLFKRLKSEFGYNRHAPYSLPKRLDSNPPKIVFDKNYVNGIMKALSHFFDTSIHLHLQQILENPSYDLKDKLYFNSNQNQFIDFLKRCIKSESKILTVEKNEILTEWVVDNFVYNKRGNKSDFSSSTVQKQLDSKGLIKDPQIHL